MKRIVLTISYRSRTKFLMCASFFVRVVAVPCRVLAVCLYSVARFFERLPDRLARFALYIAEPSNLKES